MHPALRCAALCLILIAHSRSAGSQTPLPDFTGRRVVVAGTPDTGFSEVAPLLEDTARTSGRSWYVVVVDRTGHGEDAQHAYEDRLYEQWLRQAAAAGKPLDPDRTMLVLLAVGDRQVSVRPGFALQRDYGFRGGLIDREIVQPYFIPNARAGDFKGGLVQLVEQTEKWIAAKDQAAQAARAAAAGELARKRDHAAARVAEAVDRLRRVAAFERQRTAEGLATGDAATEIASLEKDAELAQSMVAEHPAEAYDNLSTVLARVGEIEVTLGNLVKSRDQAHDAVLRAASAMRDLHASVERAKLEDLNVAAAEVALARLDGRLAEARQISRYDYAAAVSQAERVDADVNAELAGLTELRAQAQADERQRFLTHIVLPGAGLAVIALGSLGMLFLKRRSHLRRRAEIAGRLTALNERIVGVMQTLDQLKDRVRLYLLAEGNDPKHLAGATLDAFLRLQQTLETTWKVWLDQNERSTEAKRMLAAEGWIGTKILDQAEGVIRAATDKDDPQVQAALDQLTAGLDRLERARDAAHAAMIEAAKAREESCAGMGRIGQAGYATAPYADALAKIDGSLRAAVEREVHDPLGAGEDARQALRKLRDVAAWTGRILRDVDGLAALRKGIDDAAAQAAAARGEGFLLTEDNGNPDPLLQLARVEVEETRQYLASGDDAGAREQLRQGTDFVDRATHVVEAQKKARDFIAADVPVRRAETQRLAGCLPPADQAQATLAHEHRADAWTAVARNAGDARGWIEGCEARIAEAEKQAGRKVQRYFAAANGLEAVKADQERADRALREIHARLAQLVALRDESGRALTAWNGRVQALTQYASQQGGRIQADARARSARAQEWLASAHAEAAQTPPNWERVAQVVVQTAVAVQDAERAAQADVSAWEALQTRLAEARRRGAEVQGFLDAHTEDRPGANQKQAAGQAVLAQVERGAVEGNTAWSVLAGRTEEALALVERARQMAEQDVAMVQSCLAEIDESARLISAAGGFARQGVRVDFAQAGATLDDARRAFNRGDYEGTIDLANRAENEIRAARHRAEERVRQIEAAIEQERLEAQRRRDAERQALAASVSAFSSGSSGSSSSSCSSWGSSSSGSSSGSSFSSW